MSALPQHERWTEAEYLAFERQQEYKHEFWNGQVYAMSGASESHNLITGSILFYLYSQLRGSNYQLYSSQMRLKCPSVYVYPDFAITDGEGEFIDEYTDTLTNPTVIIEVLSPSTERYDRGDKFQSYRQIETLREYVLISQNQPRIERFERREDEWGFTEAVGLDATMPLPSIGCTLALADVYEQITFTDSDE